MGTKRKEHQGRVLQIPACSPPGRPWKVLVLDPKLEMDKRCYGRPFSERIASLLRMQIDLVALLTELTIGPAKDFVRPAKNSGA